jgi:uncharacterized membrane-anchored protein YitT (DUF2179 family)
MGLLKEKADSDTSSYLYAKAYLDFIIITKGTIKDIVLITIGIFSASFGFKGFLMSNHFIDGGATGISLLISNLTTIPLYLLLIVINIPFIVLGYHIIGKQFAIRTALAIIGLALCVAYVEFPIVTNNDILVAIFGGTFLGAGIGFSIRGGAVIDGTEILAIYLSKKLGTTIGDIIILINVLIFSAAMYFLSVEIALFSMVTYLAASKTLDFIIEGIDEYMGVTIVSTHFAEIKEMIINKMGRGITVYKGERGFGTRGEMGEVNILYTVVTRLEMNKLKTEIELIDSNAFVVMNSVKDTKGGMIKRKPLKH